MSRELNFNAMSDIKFLNLINRSSDSNNSDYVIFQKNETLDTNTQNIAWMVIKNLGNNCNHPFTYSPNLSVGAKDSNGNYMPSISADTGNVYSVEMNNSGHILTLSPNQTASNPEEVETWNKLTIGGIDAEILRDGKLLAKKTNVVPGSKANFKFKPSIFIGCVSQVEQGSVMDSNITVQYLTEIPLLGVGKGDIVISGGGSGQGAVGYKFTLENYS